MSTLQLSDCRSSSSLFCCQFEQTTLTPFGVLLSNIFFVPRSYIASFRLFIDQVCNIFHMWESSLRVVSERQMRHVIPLAINRLLQYSIFQLHTFQSSWWMHIQIQSSQKKKKNSNWTNWRTLHFTISANDAHVWISLTAMWPNG